MISLLAHAVAHRARAANPRGVLAMNCMCEFLHPDGPVYAVAVSAPACWAASFGAGHVDNTSVDVGEPDVKPLKGVLGQYFQRQGLSTDVVSLGLGGVSPCSGGGVSSPAGGVLACSEENAEARAAQLA